MMTSEVNDNVQQSATRNNPRQNPDKKPEKIRPDEGQGSKGNFGNDGDWGKDNEDLKRTQRETSPVPIKEAK